MQSRPRLVQWKGQPWDHESNARIVADALAIFGIERCMFAAYFPVARLRIAYRGPIDAVSQMPRDRSAADRDGFFRKNAAAFHRL